MAKGEKKTINDVENCGEINQKLKASVYIYIYIYMILYDLDMMDLYNILFCFECFSTNN